MTGLGAVIGVAVLGGLGFVYSGAYDIGADSPHWGVTKNLISTLRERSVENRASDIVVPDLKDPARVLRGAGHYSEMCTGCHLSPAQRDSEMRPGLYPQPPKLSDISVDPKEAFWTIKHGIKMSGMPAWGTTHDDGAIWDMVAFIHQLPGMSAAQYKKIVAAAPADDDAEADHSSHDHDHDHGPDTSPE
ncbi:c-type cytochrome [Stakelama marina]|uniref:c-type cytochrome n=1 Tax=Stakelama marina TaxID=2826939 RepID=UPI0024C282C5|nr:cytochrome c [Stakelama marina]